MRRAMLGLPSVAVLMLGTGALLGPPAHADRVILTNGNALEGKATILEDGSVAVTSAMGTWTVAAHRVARVERTETIEDHVESVLRATPEPGPGVLFDLAVWCRERGATTLARQLAERAIELDPDYEPARRLLGHRLHEGRWLTEEEWRAMSRAAGRDGDGATSAGPLDVRAVELREAQTRLFLERAQLELAARMAVEREAARSVQTYGFPIGWVLAAPFVPPVVSPVAPPASETAPPAPARPRAARPVPGQPSGPIANRSRLLPPGS